MQTTVICLMIPAAFVLDIIFGDPQWKYHPVRLMGKVIERIEPFFRSIPVPLVVSGAFFAIGLISMTFLLSFAAIAILWVLSPVLGFILETILIYFCISAGALERSAREVFRLIMHNRILEARKELAMIVGRDVEHLDANALTRATVETVAENLVDGVIAPLFFAVIGGASLALTYKMVNTLDSMVGYKNEKYCNFGKISARIDDIVNYLPARLSVPIISAAAQILSKKGTAALKTAKKEGRQHTSPNAGYPEAAFAGSLSVRLGGPSYYDGKPVKKPLIGIDFADPESNHIKKAFDLMILSSVLWIIFIWTLNMIVLEVLL